jgi:type I restriction enzyme, S subunit
MGGYLAYTEYKESGVEWIEKIPSHWKFAGLTKYLQSLVDYRGKTPEKTKDGAFLVTAKNIKNGIIDYSLSQEFVDAEQYDEIMRRGKPEIGDVLMTTEAPLGEVANVDNVDIALAQRVIKLQGRKGILDNYFLKYWIISAGFQQHLSSLCTGSTALGIKASKLCLLRVAFPFIEEQRSIARFLDYKTAQIDALIAKKETLLKKLAEKRTALISQAVTKGCDRAVPMKDSGVEWLGEIPVHWSLCALGYVCNIASGGTPDRNNPEYWNGDIPWIKTGEVTYQNIDEAEEYITNVGLINSSASLASPGTLLMAMYGQGNTRGRVSILCIKAAFNQACLAISPHKNINVRFLYYYLIAAYQYVRDFGNESSQMNLSAGMISKIKFLIASLEEQQNIVLFLDNQTAIVEQQKAKVEQAIAKLKEYRTALITNAVTGKIDVRDVIPELEPLEVA